MVVGSIIPKPSLFRLQFAISAHYQATKGVCKPHATSNFPETRCSFLPIAQPSALFVAHSAFITHSVTSEAFAMKPKPRLCPRLISPISPICPNPETLYPIPRNLGSFALPCDLRFCPRLYVPLSLLYHLLGLLHLLATSEAFAPKRNLVVARFILATWQAFAHPCDLRSLCILSETWQAFSPPRNLSAFSAFLATDGFLRP